MPYIDAIDRAEILNGRRAETPGELNYRLTITVLSYIRSHDLNYQTINDIKGALQGALAEFDRRVTAPYENRKRAENGDVYPPEIAGKVT
jgi:hypothetical protein